jgi:arginine:ornithine antiporter/lysine permease
MSHDTHVDNPNGVGYFGLIGLVVSSCIGSGVFALTGQLANVASPGAALLAWLICGAGFLFLALSISNVGAKRPDLDGICAYAEEGFGPFHGFVSVGAIGCPPGSATSASARWSRRYSAAITAWVAFCPASSPIP